MAIVRLTEALKRKIAAGEVIERPASVLKELVENAIDAGSERIEIELQAGGIESILVRDDGAGMTQEDLRLCVERYATSKIRTEADLDRINTLGFRGEGLASIAAVSRLRITSCPRNREDQEKAHELLADAGEVKNLNPIGRGPGTTVDVRNLFYNLPARARFLGTSRTEFLHCNRVIHRAALQNPEIGWTVTHDGRSAFSAPPAQDLLERIAQSYGSDVARALIPVEGARGEIQIHGYISRPDLRRGNRRDQILIVNGRVVADRGFSYVLSSAYRGLLRPGGYPIAVLRMDLPPDQVDVNIHPRKEEVRLAQPRHVQDALAAALHQALASPHVVSSIVRSEAAHAGSGGKPSTRPMREASAQPLSFNLKTAVTSASRSREAEKVRVEGDHRVIGQFQFTYLLVETPDGLDIVDQHIAHERILYERLRQQLMEDGIPRQLFLLPVRVEVPFETSSILSAGLEQLEAVGIVLEEFGGGTFLFREYPRILADEQSQNGFQDLAEELAAGLQEGVDLKDALFDKLLSTMACHAAVRAGDRLTLTEGQRIVENLMALENPYACPHGRPIIFQLEREELDRRFRRT